MELGFIDLIYMINNLKHIKLICNRQRDLLMN